MNLAPGCEGFFVTMEIEIFPKSIKMQNLPEHSKSESSSLLSVTQT